MNMRQQCALAENVVSCGLKVGCVGYSVAKRSRKAILPLYLKIVRPHLEYDTQVWVFSAGGHRYSGVSLAEAYRMARGLEHRMYAKMLGQLGLFRLKKRKLKEDLIAVYNCLIGRYTIESNSSQECTVVG